jgi:hypothetical protein
MKVIRLFFVAYFSFVLFTVAKLEAQTYPELPILNWEQRSDWLNVKALPSTVNGGVSAKGNGVNDDTQAIQAAFNEVRRDGSIYSTVYLPEGTYRITSTIHPPYIKHRAMHLRGHGRNTRIVWYGAQGGRMFRSDSAPFSSYIGVVWDGRNVAAEGFIHATTVLDSRETKVLHYNVAFMNFTGQASGTSTGKPDQAHTEGSMWQNCLFINCGKGLYFPQWNDYVITIDGCEFYDNGIGVSTLNGNFYLRNSHFERSTQVDIQNSNDTQSSTVRRVTSVGSRAFYERPGTTGPLFTMQDCHVEGWTNTGYAVMSSGTARNPFLMFDCTFKNAPSSNPPVSLGGATSFVHSNNVWSTGGNLVGGNTTYVQEIPKGVRGGSISSASQKFFKTDAHLPGKLFDAKRDFGAKGDNVTDDTQAIQNCINAARDYGNGAIAYIPRGNYIIKKPVNITGGNYFIGGSGTSFTQFRWGGSTSTADPTFLITNPQNITIENLGCWCPGANKASGTEYHPYFRIIGATNQPSHLFFDNVYCQSPERDGLPHNNFGDLEVKELAVGSTLLLNGFFTGAYSDGQMVFNNCSGARIMLNHAEGNVGIKGKTAARSGFVNVQSHQGTFLIEDNHSVVASDSYFEQGPNEYARLKGSTDFPAGRVTLSSPRLHTWKARDVGWIDDFIIENYHGTLSQVASKSNSSSEPQSVYRTVQTGASPFNLVYLANNYYDAAPIFNVAAHVSRTLIGNWVATTNAIPVANVTNANSMLQASQALDHFRELGHNDLAMNYGIGQPITALPKQPVNNYFVSVYPTATSDMVHFKGLPENSRIEIMDMLGRSLFVRNASEIDGGVSLKSYVNGLYLIKVIHRNELIQTLKVFKK